MENEALRWFKEGVWDLETAKILHNAGRYNAAAYYSHQAAEKAVKALLYTVNEAPWGHSVRILLEKFGERKNLTVNELLPYARELDRHYVPSRYPNAHPAGTPHEAYDEATSQKAIEAAERLISFAKMFIEEE
ncbi:MAG: HEPN domain-containing protein [Thermoproteota archaeon]|nr:HEPN domain-containing protein [Candidatus Brockarchaeota archaeon]MBO3840693.1 HEPN domain-containing protein [Candidatus Brockarchaeota archaeon]